MATSNVPGASGTRPEPDEFPLDRNNLSAHGQAQDVGATYLAAKQLVSGPDAPKVVAAVLYAIEASGLHIIKQSPGDSQ